MKTNTRQILTAAIAAANIGAFNDQSVFFGEFAEKTPHGSVCVANDSNFDAQHLSEPLSEYIVGYPDIDGLIALIESAAPSVPVSRAFTYRTHEDKEAFQLDAGDEDIREIGGDFPQIRLTGTQVDGRTDNKGLIMVLDNDQGGEDIQIQQRAVANLRQRLIRTELYRLKVLLEANDTAASSSNWGASNTSADPDAEVLAQVDTSGDSRGINPNVVLFGGGAMVKRKRSYSGRDKAGAFAGLMMTAPDLAKLYGVDKVLEAPFRYQSSSTAKTKVIADTVFFYYAKQGAMTDDPSNVKRFVTATPSGTFRVYTEARLKKTLVCVEHYSRLVCTSTLGIRSLPVTFT